MSATPPPDWHARAIAYAEAYAAWAGAVVQFMQPIMAQLSLDLQRVFGANIPQLMTSYRRVQRSYRRDLHRAYRRRYHQRPPLKREYER